MRAFRRAVAALLALSVAASGASAALMDVNLNAEVETRGRPARPSAWGGVHDYEWSGRDLPAGEWRPGSPLYERGEEPEVAALAATGNVAAAAGGMAAGWHGAMHGNAGDKASVAGFAFIALIGVLGLFHVWKDGDKTQTTPADGN